MIFQRFFKFIPSRTNRINNRINFCRASFRIKDQKVHFSEVFNLQPEEYYIDKNCKDYMVSPGPALRLT